MEIGSEILIKIKKITLRISTDSSVPSSYRTYGSGFTQIGYLEKKFYQAGSPGGVKKDSETEYNYFLTDFPQTFPIFLTHPISQLSCLDHVKIFPF